MRTNTDRLVLFVIATLVCAAAGLGWVRLRAIDYDLGFMVPQVEWEVAVIQTLEGRGEPVKLSTWLPASDERQQVVHEWNQSADLSLDVRVESGGRVATWEAPAPRGPRQIRYEYRVNTTAVQYDIAEDFRLGDRRGGADARWVQPTDVIQSAAPDVIALAESLTPEDRSLRGFLRAAFDRVQALEFRPFKGTTDALTALRLGEASCNGRSRLLAAILRSRGIPARLVGGILLEPGARRTSHQWLEARVGGHWIPMDATNDHFASLPHNYLVLYRGDESLFRHTSDIGFRYGFEIRRRLVPRRQEEATQRELGLWGVFEKLGIPLDLLKVVIMIPLAAVVVVIFRNVVGLRTFGTFLPALIAAAATHTGFLWGAVGFTTLILLGSLVRRLTARLELLHSPQLAVLLTTVIGAMLLTAFVADGQGLRQLARISLFPVAILAITAERFTLVEIEEGLLESVATLGRTLLVVFFCHLTMSSLSLQILMLGFPELLLVVIAIDIWLGRWMGLRLTEWLRFRTLLVPEAEGSRA